MDIQAEIKSIAIIGGGTMGTSIFNYLSRYNFPIVWYTRSNSEKAGKKNVRKLKRLLKNNIISQNDFDYKIDNHKVTNRIEAAYTADLIIESISERLDLKQKLFQNLFKHIPKKTIVSTNSSSFLAQELSAEYCDRIVGTHFFFPVETKNFIELIAEVNTKSVEEFLKSVNLRYLKQDSKSAFLLNRIFKINV